MAKRTVSLNLDCGALARLDELAVQMSASRSWTANRLLAGALAQEGGAAVMPNPPGAILRRAGPAGSPASESAPRPARDTQAQRKTA